MTPVLIKALSQNPSHSADRDFAEALFDMRYIYYTYADAQWKQLSGINRPFTAAIIRNHFIFFV